MISLDYKNAYPTVINQIPKSSLGYKTNNVYPQFPPLMADGRSVISSWNTESVLNDKLCKENNIQTNWEYRKYLTKNAVEIMHQNFMETANDTGNMFMSKEPDTPNIPFSYNSLNEQTKPVGYETSDLKEIYLTKEQLYSRKVAPTISLK
jgi:hypothetical protein